jgi:hypothetical protein
VIEKLFEDAETSDDLVLYFFIKTGNPETQESASVLRNLVFQLYSKAFSSPDLLIECNSKIMEVLSDKRSRGPTIDFKDLAKLRILFDSFAGVFNRQIFMVIDGLDECSDRRQTDFIRVLRELGSGSVKLKLLAASRLDGDIETAMEGSLSVKATEDDNMEDIRIYATKELGQLPGMTDAERRLACETIVERSAGSFRYEHSFQETKHDSHISSLDIATSQSIA